MMKTILPILAAGLFVMHAVAGDVALVNASNHVAATQHYLSTNSVARLCDTNAPIRIYTPAGHPDWIIGYPFKRQKPVVVTNGWTEIAILFDCSFLFPEAFQVTRFPKKNGERFVVQYNINEHSRSCRSITNYNQLAEQ